MLWGVGVEAAGSCERRRAEITSFDTMIEASASH
jgi:hypothetical protein